MPTPYEYTYGDVKFYDLAGTLVLDTQASAYALYLVEDDEPSPDPKWVRVEVPGADGAVDLSRALTGQVQYATRDITLKFAGSQATHALALGVVRTFRKLLHGQRLRIQTMLTAQVSGYYVADVECDGTADPAGIVEITVTAICDPFIRVGTQTLALTGTTKTAQGPLAQLTSPTAALVAGAGYLEATFPTQAFNPQGATTAHLWYARGANLLDVSAMTMRAWTWDKTNASPSPANGASVVPGVTVDGQTIVLGSIDAANTYKVDMLTSARKSTSLNDTGIPFLNVGDTYGNKVSLCVFLSGSISAVDSPAVRFGIAKDAGVDQYGWISSGTTSEPGSTGPTTPAAGTYGDERVCTGTINLDSIDSMPLQALWIRITGVTGTDMRARVSMVSGATVPTTWEPADLGYATVDFGGTWCAMFGSSPDDDAATIYPWGEVVTTHNRQQTANLRVSTAISPAVTTYGSVDGWPTSDATAICLSAVNAYGEECASNVIKATSYAIGTKTGSNSTMRSTPTVTTTGGAYVKLGGRVAIVPSGAQELQALTVPGGSFSVDYATLDGQAGTLTWEGGVL